MTAWNDTFPVGGLYWSERAFVLMFWEAFNERRISRGNAPYPDVPIGANIQSATATGPTSSSITSMTRAGSTVSLTTSTAHGWTAGTEIFIQGANETDYNGRWTLATTPTTTTATFSIGVLAPTTPATGTIIGFSSKFPLRVIQDWLESECDQFLDPNVDFVNSLTTDEWRYTITTWRAEAGINSAGFRRRKPREISSTTASTDTNSNTATIGQRAWLTTGGNAGKLHECTATGPSVWSLIEVRSEVQRVDLSGADDPNGGTWELTILGQTITGIAYNVSAANLQNAIVATSGTGANQTTVSKSGFQYSITFPSYLGDVAAVSVNSAGLTSAGSISVTITEVTKGYSVVPAPDQLDSTTAAPNNVAYGKQAAGDYIGGWMFTELRDGMNSLMLIPFTSLLAENDYWRAIGSDGSKPIAESEWDAGIAQATWDGTNAEGSYSDEAGGSKFLYTALREELAINVQSEIAGVAEFYIRASKTKTGVLARVLTEYDDFGTSLPEDEFYLHDSISFSVVGGTTQQLTTPWTISQPPRPDWAVSSPGSRGFVLTFGAVVYYDYAYTPLT